MTVTHADRGGFLPSEEESALGKRQIRLLKVAPSHRTESCADRYYFQSFLPLITTTFIKNHSSTPPPSVTALKIKSLSPKFNFKIECTWMKFVEIYLSKTDMSNFLWRLIIDTRYVREDFTWTPIFFFFFDL